MITIKPFQSVHALNIAENINESFIYNMEVHEREGNGITAYYNDEIFVCGGVHVIWKGVGEIWTVPSKLVKKHPLDFHKFMLNMMPIFREKYGLVRMQSVVDADEPMHIKWIQSLGFELEGRMKKYYAGKDYYMCGRVF